MPYIDFMDTVDILKEAVKEDFKDQMTLHSFGAWQIIETLKGMFGETNSMSFSTYATKLGLIDKDEQATKAQIEIQKQLALSTAREIVNLHKQGAKE
jgi:cobalamin biosynthesis Co2+ chelatase CbiK